VDRLFTALGILIVYPWLAAVVGVLVAGLGWRIRRRAPLIAGALWLLYSAYETGMQQRWLCSGECNIRVDLLLIYPALLLSLLVAAVSILRGRKHPQHPA
jgi:formate hydrogenlyase subunit 3/multisubunit Na+/H+ antiporter MnhD subunit